MWINSVPVVLYLQGEYFRCPPPIISIFWICYRDRKIRNTCFLFFPVFIFGGVKTAFKVRIEKSFLWNISRTIRDRGIVSMDEFCVFECEYDWLTRFSKSPFFPQKWFFNPNFERSFHPPNMKTGENKKTRISYFSVLYNISKNQNDRRAGHLKYSPC